MNITAEALLRGRIVAGAICGVCFEPLPPDSPFAAGSFRAASGLLVPFWVCAGCNSKPQDEASATALLRPLALLLWQGKGNA